jgi:hypothetical protein
MMTHPKLYYVLRVALGALLCVGCGLLMLWAGPYADEFFDLFLVFVGLVCILFNLPLLFQSLRAAIGKTRWGVWGLLVSTLAIALGLVFLLMPRDSRALPYLLAVYALVLPVLRVIGVADRRRRVLRELPKPLVAGMLISVTVLQIEDLAFRICGFVLIGVAVLYLAVRLLIMRPYFEALEERLAEEQNASEE